MAYLDAQLLFSDAQSVTATAVSTNVVDFGSAQNVGVGENLYAHINIDTAMAGAGATVTVTIETAVDEAFSSPTVAQTIGTFAAVSAAGSKLIAKLQPNAIVQRYARLRYTVAGGTLTASAFTAALLKDIDAYTSYADAITIS